MSRPLLVKWKLTKLGEILEAESGGTPRVSESSFWNGDIPWYSSGELNALRTVNPERHITTDGLKYSNAKIYPTGSLLIGMYDTAALKMSILDRPAAFNQAIAGVKPREEIDLLFILQQINWKRDSILAQRRGVRQKNLNLSKIRDIDISLPPLTEQRRISEILDRAEALRSKRRNALVLINELHEATFLDLFGDPLSNPKNWTIRSLGSVIAKGPQNGMYKPASEYGSGTPILRIDAFYDGQITNHSSLKRLRIPQAEIQHYGLLKNDIVINRVNSIEYLGKSALIQGLVEPTVFESNMMRFSVDESLVLPVFVNFLLQTKALKQQIQKCAKQAVNQASINQKDVAAFEIPVPPLSLQEEFRRRVQSIETLKKQQRQSLSEMNALFESLQHRAFRGEL